MVNDSKKMGDELMGMFEQIAVWMKFVNSYDIKSPEEGLIQKELIEYLNGKAMEYLRKADACYDDARGFHI